MTEAQPANSGELSSFLHLTGWRPLLLAIVAGLAGAYGLFLALDAPAQWQARYVLNANRIADDDLTTCLLYTSPSPRDQRGSRMPSSA